MEEFLSNNRKNCSKSENADRELEKLETGVTVFQKTGTNHLIHFDEIKLLPNASCCVLDVFGLGMNACFSSICIPIKPDTIPFVKPAAQSTRLYFWTSGSEPTLR